jgi:tRNA(Phe) wybutosine-synthesizing methylase Tyw3
MDTGSGSPGGENSILFHRHHRTEAPETFEMSEMRRHIDLKHHPVGLHLSSENKLDAGQWLDVCSHQLHQRKY